MCDSARCPQATHHPRHRPVWAEHAERTRLQADYDRAVRVVNEIDTAAGAHDEEPE